MTVCIEKNMYKELKIIPSDINSNKYYLHDMVILALDRR